MEEKPDAPEEKKPAPPASRHGPQTKILIQPYLWRRQKKGQMRLEAAPPVECRTIMDGQRRLDKIRAGQTCFDGAHLVRITADPDVGDYGEPEFLGQAGDVPETEA